METKLPDSIKAKSLRVVLAESRYGTPRPQIIIETEHDVSHRHTSALVHTIAACVELASGPHDGWSVESEVPTDSKGIVWLELVRATPIEVERALRALGAVIESVK